MENYKTIKNYISSDHFIYSLLPNIKIYDKDHNTLGFMKIRFRTYGKKYNYVFKDQDNLEILYILERIKLPKRAFGYKVLTKDKKEIFIIKHLGPRILFKKNVFELTKNKKVFGYIKETSSNLFMIKHSFLLIPLVGEFIYSLASFIPKSFLLYCSSNATKTSQKVAKIKIQDNFVNIGLKLDLINDLMDDETLTLISAILELLEVSSKR